MKLKKYYLIYNKILNDINIENISYQVYQNLRNNKKIIRIIVDNLEDIINEKDKINKNKIIENLYDKLKSNKIYKEREIILVYKTKKKGEYKIFGEKFVKMNENNITLIFDDIIYPLVDKLELKEGENKIQLIIKNPLTNLSLMFFNCKTLYNIDELKYLNTNHCFDFSSIFSGCDLLENVKPLEKWVFPKSCNLANMFKNISLSDVKPLEKWYVLNCTNFRGMFYGCSSLSNSEGLEKWDVSNCTDFSKMFFNCSSLSDIKMGCIKMY